MNKLILILFFLSFSFFGTKPASSKNYAYCNVFLANFCFSITDGDSYYAEASVDFTMYTINLKNGDSIEIYEGRHPEFFDHKGAYISKLYMNEYSISAIKVNAYEQRILVEPTAVNIPKSDIFVKLHSKDSSVIQDFLGNFKSCYRTKLEIKCKEESLLDKVIF